MRSSFLIAALLMIVGPRSGRAENLRVSDVRFWSLTEATRVAIEVSGEFDYHAERLHNPERVFFDIYHARPRLEYRRGFQKEVNDKLLRRIRVAETTPGVTRIVFDLAGPVEFSASQIANPDRLMVELRPGVAPAIPPVIAPAVPVPDAVAAQPAATVPPASVLRTGDRLPKPAEPPANTQIAAAPAVPLAPPAVPRLEEGKAARHTKDGGSSLVRALGLKINRIVIDPGHGGHDQGTVGPHGLIEKELVLDVAKRLGKLIEERMGSEVIYTRTDDTFIPLEGRTALANEKKADLFLSLHANSSPYPRIAGVETFYLNFTSAKDALDVAARENASSQKSVYELRDLIQKITLQDKIEESREFADRIQTALFGFAARYHSGIRNRGVKKAPFVVLIGASMPSVLAEIGFLSNAREESLLKRPEHRQRLAEALYRGVSRYAQGLSHFQMAQAKD